MYLRSGIIDQPKGLLNFTIVEMVNDAKASFSISIKNRPTLRNKSHLSKSVKIERSILFDYLDK